MTYGVAYVFLKQSRDGQPMNVADVFRASRRISAARCCWGLLSSLFTFLWGLLLVVPGIVKAYSYSQAFFVKVDHPEYDWRACMDESIRMMDGHKMDLLCWISAFWAGISWARCASAWERCGSIPITWPPERSSTRS